MKLISLLFVVFCHHNTICQNINIKDNHGKIIVKTKVYSTVTPKNKNEVLLINKYIDTNKVII